MMNQTGKERKLYFDILRIIAITCVVYNHTNEYGYYRYAIVNNQVFSCLYAALGAFIAIGVPLFFMISGALLLEKEEFLRSMQPFPRFSCMEECLLNNPDTKALSLQSMFSCDTAYYRGYPAASEERISDA